MITKEIKGCFAVIANILLLLGITGCTQACYDCYEVSGDFKCIKNNDTIYFGSTIYNALDGNKQITDTLTYYKNMGYSCDTISLVHYMNGYAICGKAAHDADVANGAYCLHQ